MSGPGFLAARGLVQPSTQELRHDVGVEAIEIVSRNCASNVESHLPVQVNGRIVVGSNLQVAFVRMMPLQGGYRLLNKGVTYPHPSEVGHYCHRDDVRLPGES